MSTIEEETNPVADVDSFEQRLHTKELTKGDVDAQIRKAQYDLDKLLAERTKLQQELASDRYELSKKRRALALWEKDQEIEKEIARLDELIGLAREDEYWNETAEDFQLEGAAKLAIAKGANGEIHGFLGDKRGLGKSYTSLIWRKMVGSKRTLVLAPKRLAHQYVRQVMKWSPETAVLSIAHLNADARYNQFDFIKNIDDVIIVANYESWRKNDHTLIQLENMGFDALVMDEAHNLKDFGSKAAKGVVRLAKAIKVTLGMSGTPMLNAPKELFTQFHIIDPVAFPSETIFLKDNAWKDGNKWRFRNYAFENLMRRMSKHMVTRTRDDVGIHIPPPSVEQLDLDFDGYPEQEEAYEMLTNRAIIRLESGKFIGMPNILAILSAQRQMTEYPASMKINERDDEGNIIAVHDFSHVKESVKADAAMERLFELYNEGDPVIFISEFKGLTYHLRDRLEAIGIHPAVLTGDTPRLLSEEIQDDFELGNKNPKYQIMLATRQTIGEGMNLHRARDMDMASWTWSPGREDQLVGRIDRMDSVDQARVTRYHIAGTSDDFMKLLNEDKKYLVEGYESYFKLQQDLADALRATLRKK